TFLLVVDLRFYYDVGQIRLRFKHLPESMEIKNKVYR
ncbi:hypothetical protein D021_1774B, partial [Vibrio parahaemolyticus 10296]